VQGIECNYVAATEQSLMRRLGEKKKMWKSFLQLGWEEGAERKTFFACGKGKVWSRRQGLVKIISVWTMAVRDRKGIRSIVVMQIEEAIQFVNVNRFAA
jgi:hypothetical protein